MNRYFLVWYMTNLAVLNQATVTSDSNFVNEKEFEKWIIEKFPGVTKVMISNIFEFKNSQDFDEYNRK